MRPLLIGVAALLVGCDDSAPASDMLGADLMIADAAGVVMPSASVTITDYEFNPRAVTIKQGGKVTWTWMPKPNAPNSVHSVTSDDNSLKELGSPLQSTGSYVHQFAAAGSYPYHCMQHAALETGMVTVLP